MLLRFFFACILICSIVTARAANAVKNPWDATSEDFLAIHDLSLTTLPSHINKQDDNILWTFADDSRIVTVKTDSAGKHTLIKTFDARLIDIFSVESSDNGNIITAMNRPGMLKLWDLRTSSQKPLLNIDGGVGSFSFINGKPTCAYHDGQVRTITDGGSISPVIGTVSRPSAQLLYNNPLNQLSWITASQLAKSVQLKPNSCCNLIANTSAGSSYKDRWFLHEEHEIHIDDDKGTVAHANLKDCKQVEPIYTTEKAVFWGKFPENITLDIQGKYLPAIQALRERRCVYRSAPIESIQKLSGEQRTLLIHLLSEYKQNKRFIHLTFDERRLCTTLPEAIQQGIKKKVFIKSISRSSSHMNLAGQLAAAGLVSLSDSSKIYQTPPSPTSGTTEKTSSLKAPAQSFCFPWVCGSAPVSPSPKK